MISMSWTLCQIVLWCLVSLVSPSPSPSSSPSPSPSSSPSPSPSPSPSLSSSPPRFLLYDPRLQGGGLNSQLRSLSVALVLGRVLNRTVVVPPFDDGSTLDDYYDGGRVWSLGGAVAITSWEAFAATLAPTAHTWTTHVEPGSVTVAEPHKLHRRVASIVRRPWLAWDKLDAALHMDPRVRIVSLVDFTGASPAAVRQNLRTRYRTETRPIVYVTDVLFQYCLPIGMGHPLFFGWHRHLGTSPFCCLASPSSPPTRDQRSSSNPNLSLPPATSIRPHSIHTRLISCRLVTQSPRPP